MLVKVPEGRAVYREGYYRTAEDGVFRLYEKPPPKDIPYDDQDPHGPTAYEKWLGCLEPATEWEVMQFEASPSDVDFEETVLGSTMEEAFGRAGQITLAVHGLDHDDDACWSKDGEPLAQAVQDASGLVNVKQHEVRACAPEVRRLPVSQRGDGIGGVAPRKQGKPKGG